MDVYQQKLVSMGEFEEFRLAVEEARGLIRELLEKVSADYFSFGSRKLNLEKEIENAAKAYEQAQKKVQDEQKHQKTVHPFFLSREKNALQVLEAKKEELQRCIADNKMHVDEMNVREKEARLIIEKLNAMSHSFVNSSFRKSLSFFSSIKDIDQPVIQEACNKALKNFDEVLI